MKNLDFKLNFCVYNTFEWRKPVGWLYVFVQHAIIKEQCSVAWCKIVLQIGQELVLGNFLLINIIIKCHKNLNKAAYFIIWSLIK